MKKNIITLAIILVALPSFAHEKNNKSKQCKSLIGKTEVGKIADVKFSVGDYYEPSPYPKSSYVLGTDGMYHYLPSAKKSR